MLFKRIGSEIIYNVTNPDLIPLYKGNEAYEEVKADDKPEEEKTKRKTTKTKK